jgi:hypothetical protein
MIETARKLSLEDRAFKKGIIAVFDSIIAFEMNMNFSLFSSELFKSFRSVSLMKKDSDSEKYFNGRKKIEECEILLRI